MDYNIVSEIENFDLKCQQLEGDIHVEKLADFVYLLSPKTKPYPANPAKDIDLTLMAITHGNEFVGVRVLNEILNFISQDSYQLRLSICMILGNPAAAKRNQRFLEADLNRSFARVEWSAKEHHRARELEGVLLRTSYLLDLHQTRERSEMPFFIFPYSKGGFSFARQISWEIPIVTHWGKPFSKVGQCTDEFVNNQGGTGITLELGQNGFDVYKISAGFRAALQTIQVVESNLYKKQPLKVNDSHEVFTWLEVVEFPESGDASLAPGYYNFKTVAAGETYGVSDGRSLVASTESKILFPYYPNNTERKSAELCRLLKKIPVSELP